MIKLAEITPYIPRAFVAEALDDEGLNTGEINGSNLEQVTQAAEQRAASCFGSGGGVPQAHRGEAHQAAIIFTCEILFNRRGYSDRQNPYAAQARDWERRLRALAGGEEGSGGGGADIVSEPVIATSRGGHLV